MEAKKDVIRIFTRPTGGVSEAMSASSLVLMVGDTEVDCVFDVDIEKIETNSLITAVIRVAVTLGDK
jgi:hypothetical protein